MSEPTFRTGPNGEKYRQLASADDVTPEVLSAAESALEWFPGDERIDWEEFLDRLEKYLPGFEISELDNPAIRKIKRHIRTLRDSM